MVPPDLSLPSPAEDQILIGLHGGYNWQVQQIVLGVEGDVSFSNDANYLASIRGRLGFAAMGSVAAVWHRGRCVYRPR